MSFFLTVVLNPAAGSFRAGRSWPRLAHELEQRGYDFERVDALALPPAAPAPGAALLAAGGDGTLHALLPAVVGTGVPLGVVPLGTGNDFAGMLGLASGDVAAAAARLNKPPKAADALRCFFGAPGERGRRSELLINGLGMGFDAQVTAKLTRTPRALPGLLRYAWAALSTVRALRNEQVEVTLDGRTLYKGPSCLVAVMNGTRYGGGFLISPRSDIHDGLLDVVLSRRLNPLTLLPLMLQVLRGKHLSNRQVIHAQGRKVDVRWAKPVESHIDGDLLGPHQCLSVEVLPGAVALLSGP